MKVLILCTGNSCRSQMAEGLLKAMKPEWKVYSAGTEPNERVHPLAIEAMKDLGIDIVKQYPKKVDMFVNQEFDYVITVCDSARETCPVFTGRVKHRLHKDFFDPALAIGSYEEKMQVFSRVRDEIYLWLKEIFENID